MPRFPIELPGGETLVDEFARDLVTSLGWTAPEGSNHCDDARVLAGGTAEEHQRLGDAAAESFTTRTNEMLPAWEDALDAIASTSSTPAQRRAALTAIRRTGGSNNAAAFLRALRAIDPLATYATGSVLENLTFPRGVFIFTVRVSAAVLNDAAQRARVVDVIERMKPYFFDYRLAAREGFFTNDPGSLTDNGPDDVLAR